MALVVTIGGVNRTSVLVDDSLSVEQQAADFVSIFSLTLVDVAGNIAIAAEDAITVVDGATTFFSGRVVDIRYSLFTTVSRYIEIKCQDLNAIVGETIIDGEEVFTAEDDAVIIDSLFDDYLPAVDSQTEVATIQDPLTITFIVGTTLRNALSQICTRTGGYFYVDFSNVLHYFSDEGDGVAWWLSDAPDQIDSFSYFATDVEKVSLATTRLDGVYVIGDGVEGWRGTHVPGDRQAVARDLRITTSTGRDERGDAILAKRGNAQVTYKVSTYKAGLRAGMEVRFICALYGVDDTFTVRKLTVRWDKAGVAYYILMLGDVVNPSLISERQWVDTLPQALGPVTAPRLPTSSRGWSHTIVFSSTDNDTVAWAAAGVITLADGSAYTMDAGNTGNMGAITYIYLDLDTSETVLQTTGAAATAVGSKKILIAVAEDVAAGKDAIFQVFGGAGQGVLVAQDNIAALSVTTSEIAANTILAGNIAAGAIETVELDALAVTAAKIAANTITADKIEMGIGAGLFNAADGLLLLNPHCEISPTEWWSARKQKAILSGAFHQEAGRWLGTKGLVIEEATTNLIRNPSIETNTTFWSDDACTISKDTTYPMFGDAALKVITDNAGAGEGVRTTVTAETAADTEYTLSVWVRGSGTVRLRFVDAGGGGIQLGAVFTLTSVLTRHQLTKTFGDGAVRDIGLHTDVQQDITFYCDGWQLEEQDYPTSYADGTLGTGYAWVGTAHASTSTRAATVVNLDAHIGLISSNATLSFRVVAQMPYDSDASWPAGGRLWAAKGADANNYILLQYFGTDDKFRAYINGGYRLISDVQSFKAGDWLDLVVTLDFTDDDYNLYINGEFAVNDTTALAAPTLTGWVLGALFDGSIYWGNFNFAEYAVFDRELTAIEIAGFYALDRPSVDMGSLDKPGIFILDGRFKIASSTTGNRIELTPDEIAGYDSGGTKQFYLQSTDGKAYAGAGAVVLDASGLYMVGAGAAGASRIFRFLYDDAGTERVMGNVYGDWGGGAVPSVSWLTAWRQAGDPWNGSKIILAAIDSVEATDTRLTVNSTGLIEIGGDELRADGAAIFNYSSLDRDFIVRSDNEPNLLRVDAGTDEARFGDWDTNYSAFEVDGTLKFIGNATVWNDIFIPMTTGKLGGANTPTWEAFIDVLEEYTFGVNDLIHLPAVEIPHSYKEGTDLKVHCHIVTNGSDVGNTDVRYEIVYTIGDMGETMQAAIGFASLDITIPGGTADRTHIYIFIGTIAAGAIEMGASLKMRFNRKPLDGAGNPPTDDPFVLMVGVHAEEDTVGSRAILTK